jgi:enolase-phosphatase E1
VIGAVVVDIEGTVGSIAFVKHVLFPYARRHLADFVRAHRADPLVAQCLSQAARAAGASAEDEGRVIGQLLAWHDGDVKTPPLKLLQGMIWRRGYEGGAFTSHLYPDAHRALLRWHAAGLGLYVFSSGSAAAQRLYFAHTDFGDLSGLFQGYFDLDVGSKTEPASYRSIAERIAQAPRRVRFLSDGRNEVAAAAAAGMDAWWVRRPEEGTAVVPASAGPERVAVVSSFEELELLTETGPVCHGA